MVACTTLVARSLTRGRSNRGVLQMRKATLLIGASLLIGMSSAALATGWEPELIGTDTQQVFEAKTAGNSGNVKSCTQSTCTFNTFQWTQQTTGKTRGTFVESSC